MAAVRPSLACSSNRAVHCPTAPFYVPLRRSRLHLHRPVQSLCSALKSPSWARRRRCGRLGATPWNQSSRPAGGFVRAAVQFTAAAVAAAARAAVQRALLHAAGRQMASQSSCNTGFSAAPYSPRKQLERRTQRGPSSYGGSGTRIGQNGTEGVCVCGGGGQMSPGRMFVTKALWRFVNSSSR